MLDSAARVPDERDLYESVLSVVDDRTREIMARRRAVPLRTRGWLVHRMLLAADLLGLVAAFAISETVVTLHTTAHDRLTANTELLLFALTLPAWVVIIKLYGLYDHDEQRTDHSTTDDLVGVFHMVTVGAWLVYCSARLTGFATPDLRKLALFWALAVALVTCGRAVARTVARRSIAYLQNTVIVGAGDIGQLVARKILQHPEYGLNIVGFIDEHPKERRPGLEHVALLGSPERLPAIVRLFDVERVVIAFSNDSHDETLALVRSLKDLSVQIDIVPRLFELLGPGIGLHSVEGLPLVGLPPVQLARSSRLLKRTTDLALSAAGLVLLTPLFALIAAAIKLDSRGPVFFRQVRMGRGDATFRIFKFRTMSVDADERKAEIAHLNRHLAAGGDPRMFKVRDDPRVTRVGRLLRRTSFDELPQLLNVLKGDMSLVGPRPLILDEDRCVEAWGRRRLDLQPGITGPWQVLGRSGIPFEEMVRLDYLYATSWSIFGDFKLILRTLPALARDGAY